MSTVGVYSGGVGTPSLHPQDRSDRSRISYQFVVNRKIAPPNLDEPLLSFFWCKNSSLRHSGDEL